MKTLFSTIVLFVVSIVLPLSVEAESKARVFIMPGHEPTFGGAEYKGLKERDMNVRVARHLADYLAADSDFDAVMGRDEKGWNLALSTYFNSEWTNIQSWRDDFKQYYRDRMDEGTFRLIEDHIAHMNVKEDVGTRLYGINKWVGEHDMDLAVHIHFNDYGSRRASRPGEYSGFAVYIPEIRYSNSEESRMFGESIASRLEQFVGESDLPKESGGVVEDQELIAVGAYGTASFPSVLIEYGYIYEPQFQNKAMREILYREYAYQTYLGIKDAFGFGAPVPRMGATTVLPHAWKDSLRPGFFASADTLALQFALRKDGVYPPAGKTLNDCPTSGIYGFCTRAAVTAFQKKQGIAGDGTVVGAQTLRELNERYGFGVGN